MRGKIQRLISACLVSIILLSLAPAAGESAANVRFLGKLVLAAPMCFSTKVIVPGCVQANPKEPIPFDLVAPNPHLGAFCFGISVSSKKAPAIEAPNCAIHLMGVLVAVPTIGGPWCDLHMATGIAGIVQVQGKVYNVTNGSWTSARGAVFGGGTAQKGNQTGPWTLNATLAHDAMKGNSCVPGATQFIIEGTLQLAAVGTK